MYRTGSLTLVLMLLFAIGIWSQTEFVADEEEGLEQNKIRLASSHVNPAKRTHVHLTSDTGSLVQASNNYISWDAETEDDEGLWFSSTPTEIDADTGTDVWHGIHVDIQLNSSALNNSIMLRVFKNGSVIGQPRYNNGTRQITYDKRHQFSTGDDIKIDLYTIASGVKVLEGSDMTFGPTH